MNRAATAERRRIAADMVAAGQSVIEAAANLGVCRRTVYIACQRLGVLPPPHAIKRTGTAVRNVSESMWDPRWDGICLYRRACADACVQPATWCKTTCTGSEVLACDEHKQALGCRVALRRREVG